MLFVVGFKWKILNRIHVRFFQLKSKNTALIFIYAFSITVGSILPTRIAVLACELCF